MFFKYMIERKWESMILILLVFSITTSVFHGFHIPESTASAYIITLIGSFLMTVIFTAISYNRKTVFAGIGLFVLAIAAFVIVVKSLTGSNVFADKESNPYLFCIILIISSTATYTLSRTRFGCVVLLAAGVIAIELVYFLYSYNNALILVIFIASSGIMLMYRNYIYNVLNSRTIRVDRPRAAAVSALICLVVVVLGMGVFYGIVKPLDPPKKEVKIFTKYLSLEVVDRIGVADKEKVLDPDLKTSDFNNDTEDTQKNESKDENASGDKEYKGDNKDDSSNSAQNLNDSNNKAFKGIKYKHTLLLWLVILVILFIMLVTAVILKKYMIRHWMKNARKLSPDEHVSAVYNRLIKKFRLIGLHKSKEETPSEFAERSTGELKLFSSDKTDFKRLSDIFVKSYYGGYLPDEAKLYETDMFYEQFYSNLRAYVGNLKFVILYFFL